MRQQVTGEMVEELVLSGADVVKVRLLMAQWKGCTWLIMSASVSCSCQHYFPGGHWPWIRLHHSQADWRRVPSGSTL